MEKEIKGRRGRNNVCPGTLGYKLWQLRTLRGLSMKGLAQKCGFAAASGDVRIAGYEHNKKIPNKDSMNRLCKALDVSPAIFSNIGKMNYEKMFSVLFELEDQCGLHPSYFHGKWGLKFENIDPDALDMMREWGLAYEEFVVKNKDLVAYEIWKTDNLKAPEKMVSVDAQKMEIESFIKEANVMLGDAKTQGDIRELKNFLANALKNDERVPASKIVSISAQAGKGEKRKYLMFVNSDAIDEYSKRFENFINKKELNFNIVFVSSYEDTVRTLKGEMFDGMMAQYFNKGKGAIRTDEMCELAEMVKGNVVVILPWELRGSKYVSKMFESGMTGVFDRDARLAEILSLLEKRRSEKEEKKYLGL
jgi:transcriptional regulator with XRE-family HTH domain